MRKFILLICFCGLFGNAFSQVVIPFTKRYDVTQRGGLVMVANSMLTCNGGFGCSTGQNEVPPAGSAIDNDFNSGYIDIDGDGTTFSSSNANLNLPACSKVTFAGLYWGAPIENTNGRYAQRNKIKIKQPGASGYTTLTADNLYDFNINYGVYNCFKNITTIVDSADNGTYTLADLVSETGNDNQFAGWSIVVVYKNESMPDKNLTVFDGVASIDASNFVTITASGFYTPPSGAVNFELGEIAYDGDRGNTGDSLLFKGAAAFVKVSDALHPVNDVFNSTIANNATQVLTRNPAYKNTLGFDANIFTPNNAAKNYLANGATSAQVKITSGGDQIFLQTITTAINTYEPHMQTLKTVSDINGGTVSPGDTLLYTIAITNSGNDTSITTTIVDTLPFNGDYIPGSIIITSGPNAGTKTDAAGDDQAKYALSGGFGIMTVNLGTGANSTTGGTMPQTGANNSTTVTFKMKISDDCTELLCNPTISNRVSVNYKGVISGISRQTFSNPNLVDAFGCPMEGFTSTSVTVPVSCTLPPDTSLSGCLPLKFDSIPGIRPNYVYYNSSWASVIRANTAGTYWGIRTLIGSNCKDTIKYTVTAGTATISNAGPDQNLCNITSTNLAGNTPVIGGAKWRLISGPNVPTITANTSPTTSVTGLIAGAYKFRWSISLWCDSSIDDVNINVFAPTTIADAGADQSLCNAASTTMAGNTPTAGSGTWTRISGPNTPTITTASNPTTTITGMMPGTYVFRWTISNGACGTTSDDVTVTTYTLPTTSNAGSDQSLCNVTSTALAGNIPGFGSGLWTVISGPNIPTITTPSSPTSSMGGIIPGVYTLRWTISNGACPSSSDDVQITVYALPTTSNAGADQNLCNVTSSNLSANAPLVGTGAWTFISGPNTPTITTPGSANTSVTGMISGNYTFRWTISNGVCTPSTDQINVNIFSTPSSSNAGPDQSICNSSSATLAGNTPASGTGTWILISGPNTPSITSPSVPNTTVTGMIAGTYTFRWSIGNGPCTPAIDDVDITISNLLTISNAGPDQFHCNVNTITLAGNTAAFGVGAWTLVSGPNNPPITNVYSPTSTVTGMIPGVYTFRWMISNGICPASTDEVTITIYPLPTVANAGADQNLCNVTSAIVTGSNPVAGTGTWSFISGPNSPTITAPGNASTSITGMIPGAYVFRWTISSGTCASSTDNIQITIYALPTVANAGADQNLCNVNSTSFTGNNPVVGSGTWTLVSGPNTPTITTPSSATSTITGMVSGVYTFRWTIANGVCTPSTDDVIISIFSLPTISNAGPDQNLCNVNNIVLAGNAAIVGSGLWTLLSGPNTPTITTPSNQASTVTGMTAGVYTFRWTISNGSCTPSVDDVQITIYATPTVSIPGPDQNLCNANSTTFAANAPVNGSGNWSLISGPNTPTITAPTNPSSTVTGLITGVYIFRWTISNGVCPPSTDDILVTNYAIPTTSSAGPNQSLCNVTNTTLAGNLAVVGTGTWTLISGPNVPVITSPTSPTSTITSMIEGVYIFRWTIANGVCTPSADDVQIIIYGLPTVSNAGADQNLCNVNNTTINGNSPTTGFGNWTLISGPNTPTITTPANASSTVTGMIAGAYVFRWTITSGSCAPSLDDVQVTIFATPTIANAGPDQNLCNVNNATFAGNAPANGTGNWTLISGPNTPTITTPSNPASPITGMIAGVYEFRWTVSNGVCIPTSDDVQITIYDLPTVSSAGPDQDLCSVTSITLAGNTPLVGTGVWTIVSGPNTPVITTPSNPVSTVTGMIDGVYVFEWTISNGVCPTTSDDVTVTSFNSPTVVDAGPDQDLCNVNSTVMAGNIPGVGTGLWTLISGPNTPTILLPTDPNSGINGMVFGTYLFGWTISNGVCVSPTDTVVIAIYDLPSASNAGPNQDVCSVTSINLSGNRPTVGNGNWTNISGPNAPVITSPDSANTSATGLIPGVYIFRWTISSGPCAATFSDVQVEIYNTPLTVDAGPDQQLCDSTIATMGGNIPGVGTGTWTLLTGPNSPAITDVNDPLTTVTGMVQGTYLFGWTITNGVCFTPTDTIQIIIYDSPTVANAGVDQQLCNVTSATMTGNVAATGTGAWKKISGPNNPTITDTLSATTTITGMVTGTYLFSWTISNGVCDPTSDTMEVVIFALPTTSNAGPDQNLCVIPNATMAANAPVVGSGNWTLVSGPNVPTITLASDPATTVTGLVPGTYLFAWTISNGACALSSDTVIVHHYAAPSIANAGVDMSLCNVTVTSLAGNVPVNGTGNWTLISGPNVPVIAVPSNNSSTVSGLIQGVYQFAWTISNGNCTPSKDTVQISVFDQPTVSDAGPDQSLCSVSSVTLAANQALSGNAIWTFVSGPNTPTITVPTDSNSTVTGMIPGDYVFYWTITNGTCPPSIDSVTINIYLFPPFVDAGPDQDLCNVSNVSLVGNAPTNGIGTWEIISGPNIPTILSPNSPSTIVTGMIEGTYSFSWGIVNGTCSSYKDTMEIIVHDLATIANAGPDQALCNAVSTALAGNVAIKGTGVWTLISGPNVPTIVDATDEASTVNGMIAGVYEFSWTISNGICAASSDTVQISIFNIPTAAVAGPDQHLCNVNNVTMAGNDPMAATGTWSFVSGPGSPTITNPNDSATSITGMVQGTYVFGWSMANGVCITPTDLVTITLDDLPTPAFAGLDQNLCDDTTFILSGNLPVNGSGSWAFVSGPNTPFINSPNNVSVYVENLIPGIYIFAWTTSNGICPSSTDTVQIGSYNLPDVADADAGPDQEICNADSAELTGNFPMYGTGTWSLISGPNIPLFADSLSDTTIVNNMIQGTYLFAWTISNGICVPTIDTVQINIYDSPSIADAGVSQHLCNGGTALMTANAPAIGSGLWSFVSGPYIPTIDYTDSANTNVSGMLEGPYTFSWEITNGICPSTFDTVTIMMEEIPTTSVAGVDQILCNDSLTPALVILAGNSPAAGSGSWSLISGPNIPNISSPSSPTTNIDSLVDGTYIFEWTISNSICAPSFDSLQVDVHILPVVSDAGSDQSLCNTDSTLMSALASGNGTGTWTLVSGPNSPIIDSINDPSTTVRGMIPGVYTFKWGISSGVCTSITDSVQITIYQLPTISNAGSDQELCNDSVATLAGNIPASGSGVWSMFSGPSLANIVDSLDPNTDVTDLIAGTYMFNWTISNGVCSSFTDTIQIIVDDVTTAPNAGLDLSLCGDTTVTLSGNIPVVGSGTWSLVSGPNTPTMSCTNCSSPLISNLVTGVYTYRWTISNGVCSSPSDDIQITRYDPPSISNAGPDQTLCISDTLFLAANTPVYGTGMWTLVSSLGTPVITDVDSANTFVSNITPGTHIFRWTISNGTCTNSASDIQVMVDDLPSAPFAGQDQSLCGDTSVILSGNQPALGSGMWTVSGGPINPVINCTTCPNTISDGLLTGTYTFQWTITNGVCASVSDDVEIKRIDNPGTADAGQDQTICFGDSINLSAILPQYGSGEWSIVSGPGSALIAQQDSAQTKVTDLDAGVHQFQWTITNETCSHADIVEINVNALPVIITNASVYNICPGEQASIVASGAVTYSWSPATDLNNTSIYNPVATPDTTTKYIVWGIDQNGCIGVDSIVVDVCDVLIIPNGFSPDGDGVNDYFVIEGIERFPGSALHVFNRWGNLIYQKNFYDNTFDGIPNVNGISIGMGKVPAGTYFYVFQLGNGDKDRSGYLIIKY